MRIILHLNKRWESAVEPIRVAGPQKKWPEHGDCALKRLLRGQKIPNQSPHLRTPKSWVRLRPTKTTIAKGETKWIVVVL
jgi:hypothetical protein